MKKLIKMFKSLPPEMRMMLAMAGLGSPIGIIYALKRWCFPNTSTFIVILYVFGAIAVICLLGWLVSLLFGRGKGKRANKMASDLAVDADAGRSSMDVAAAIKENNQKFFGAISDMNKSVGLSVYDLPWYIVIGDSGCGKTKLINEGGLQFSLGKPEGYQLGTLNYNWWFTEDAVFVDMAGRLINPRDDADRKEWEAFLTTISKGRKGFPINGVVVCVAADHLLQDPPDRIEQDANTMLERLRDLQSRLGVTFATYLVITKCDKMVGFMQFFDRAERDIRVLNQMVGWSKPGEFNELYEPEEFPEQFDEVYRRLHELRLRRMNDDAEEIDLGLAYGFPEEFRELRDPLHTYVRTLFPKIKNPRAIKNLLYRGLYFTSATREGGLILKHLTDRLGPEAAEQFQPLDIYPSKRPYFIRDFFFRKMFPEHGLVFRNEEQAVRNRKLAKVLKYGSVGLALLLFGMAGLSIFKFSGVIDAPRKIATVDLAPENGLPEPSVALESAGKLEESADELSASGWATILSLWYGTDEPVRGLREIHAALFERVLLPPVIADISRSLRERKLSPPVDEKAITAAREYLTALEEYVKWYSCSGRDASSWHGVVNQASFKLMCKVVKEANSLINRSDAELLEHSNYYFATLSESEDSEDWRSPARLLDDGVVSPEETIRIALVGGVRDYHEAVARLSSSSPSPIVREWMRIREACDEVESSYKEMLKFADQGPRTLQEMVSFQKKFAAAFAVFDENLSATTWNKSIPMAELRTAMLELRQAYWVDTVSKLTQALEVCPGNEDQDVLASIMGLQFDRETSLGLDRILWQELYDAKLTAIEYEKNAYDDVNNFRDNVSELYTPFDHILTYNAEGAGSDDKLRLTPQAGTVRAKLEGVQNALAGVKLTPDDERGTLKIWTDKFWAAYDDWQDWSEQGKKNIDLGITSEKWSPEDLLDLLENHQSWIHLGRVRAILETVRNGLTNLGPYGIARLEHGADKLEPSAYYIRQAEFDQTSPGSGSNTATERADRPSNTRAERKTRTRKQPHSRGRKTQPSAPKTQRTIVRGEGNAPHWAHRNALLQSVYDAAGLWRVLKDLFPERDLDFLRSDNDDGALDEICAGLLRQSSQDYFKSYVDAWSQAYQNKTIDQLDEVAQAGGDWESLRRNLKRTVGGASPMYLAIGREMTPALAEILESMAFWGHERNGGDWLPPSTSADANFVQVARWMDSAIDAKWSADRTGFAKRARTSGVRGQKQRAPWEAIANTFGDKWEQMAGDIVKSQEFTKSFTRKPSLKWNIEWANFSELRENTQLTDERLTGQLMDFEQSAQRALGRKITSALVSIQERHMDEHSDVGWPFLDRTEPESEIHKTVGIKEFREFLVEVRGAERYFKPLEGGLPDSPLNTDRRRFYDLCKQWYRFLGYSKDDLTSTRRAALEILEATFFDPMRPNRPAGGVKIDMTGANYYGTVELTLGLKVTEADGTKGASAIKISTARDEQKDKTWQAKWDWEATGPMTFTVTDGLPIPGGTRSYKSVSQKLGTCTPLSFCAYLHHGVPLDGDRSTWITAHAVNLPKKLRVAGQTKEAAKLQKDGDVQMGLDFKFKLDRDMPEPIAELKLFYESSE